MSQDVRVETVRKPSPEMSWVCINGHNTPDNGFLYACPKCGSPFVRELWASEGGGK